MLKNLCSRGERGERERGGGERIDRPGFRNYGIQVWIWWRGEGSIGAIEGRWTLIRGGELSWRRGWLS